ncbi:GSCOCG00011396001-RA-CDS, partial [Cotesia congregata]
FVVNNGNGYRVQVYAWNDQVKRTEAVVKLDHIFYIDGGIGVANSEYNRGNYFGAQLSIQKYTTITDFGKLDRKLYSVSETNDNGELQTIELDAISNNLLPKKFRTVGYTLKLNLRYLILEMTTIKLSFTLQMEL